MSAAVSRLYLDKFGKGPVHSETFIHGDTVVTVMRDVFTVAERTMIADGNQEHVLTTRMLWQHATDAAFRASVAEVTGREVLSVVSGFQLDQELATEVFVLAPL